MLSDSCETKLEINRKNIKGKISNSLESKQQTSKYLKTKEEITMQIKYFQWNKKYMSKSVGLN
jgi:hypothetical protein